MTTDTATVLINDRWVTIRPIRSNDSAMEAGFVRNLSAATKHYRFFCALSELSPGEVSRFCNVDGPHTMAFVATVRKLLMDHLLVVAKKYGIRQLYTIELADNQAMRNFANDVGMAVERDPSDANQVIYSLGL